MRNQFAVEIPTLPSRPVSFPPHPIPEGMLSRFFKKQRRAANKGPPSIWDTHGVERRRSSEASTPSLQELCKITIDFIVVEEEEKGRKCGARSRKDRIKVKRPHK